MGVKRTRKCGVTVCETCAWLFSQSKNFIDFIISGIQPWTEPSIDIEISYLTL